MANTKDLVLDGKTGIRWLLWGPTGGGKTKLAGTWPRPYFFDFDGGVLTLAGRDIPYDFYNPREATTWQKVDAKLREFEKARDPNIDTLVFDSLTTCENAVKGSIMQTNSSTNQAFSQPQWGLYIDKIGDLLENRAPRLSRMGYHFVAIAHAELLRDEITGETRRRPLISTKVLPSRLPVWFDEVYYIDSDGKTHTVTTVKEAMIESAKSRIGLTLVKESFENRGFPYLQEKIKAIVRQA